MTDQRGLLSYAIGDPQSGGSVLGVDASGQTRRYDVARLLGAGPAVQAVASNFAATASAISAQTAAVQMASELRRLTAATAVGGAPGIEPDMVMSPLAGCYWARDVGSISGDLAAWAAGMGGAFARTSSATYFGPAGTMLTAAAGVPRIACDAVTGDRLGLLEEASTTNPVLQSNDISASPWALSAAGASISGTTVVAPDGGVAKVLTMSAPANSYVTQTGIIGIAGTTYTFSCYLQLVSGGDTLTTTASNFRTRDGAGNLVTTALSSPVTLVKGVWQRVSITATTLAAGTMSITPIFDQAGYAIAVWGAQVEVGPVATSLIPTTTAAVSRAADTLAVPLLEPGLWGAGSGTYLCEVAVPTTPAGVTGNFDFDFRRANAWADGWFSHVRSTGGALSTQQGFVAGGAWTVAAVDVPVTAGPIVRLAATWDAASGIARWCTNGGTVTTATGAKPPLAGGPLAFRSAAPAFPGYIRRVVYSRSSISAAQLQALSATTW